MIHGLEQPRHESDAALDEATPDVMSCTSGSIVVSIEWQT
jgi:hypothetical protein